MFYISKSYTFELNIICMIKTDGKDGQDSGDGVTKPLVRHTLCFLFQHVSSSPITCN